MSHRERTLQQLDPLGALSARPVAIISAVSLIAFAITVTLLTREDIDYPILAFLAIVALSLGAVSFAIWSNPMRAPLRLPIHALVLGLALTAVVFSALSMWHSNRYLQDDWGPYVVGLILLSLAPYRPARELWLSGVFAAIFVGFIALLQSHSLAAPVPPIVFVLVAATPVLALSLGAATFAGQVLRRFDRWQVRAAKAVRGVGGASEGGIARSVQQDRVTILNRDVVPFFSELIARGEILEGDREHARVLSDTIRAIMVAEVGRSWLDGVIDQAGGRALLAYGGSARLIHDPDRRAQYMATDQRTALRALLVALIAHPGFSAEGFALRLERRGDETEGLLHVRIIEADSTVRSELTPYFAVMRVVFPAVDADVHREMLTLRFAYGTS